METSVVHNGESSGPEGVESRLQVEPQWFPCIRCGVCCSVYQVRIGRGEASLIAESMDMDYWDWVGKYCDPRWSDPRSHLIRHDDLGCVFLDHSSRDGATCSIYAVRPASCRDWSAGAFKPACQEGLRRFWGVTVDPAGQPQGSAADVSRLREFLGQLQ